MLLGTRNITQGDTRRVVIDYRGWLDKGVVLETITVSVPAGTTSTVQGAVLTEDKRSAVFMSQGEILTKVSPWQCRLRIALPRRSTIRSISPSWPLNGEYHVVGVECCCGYRCVRRWDF